MDQSRKTYTARECKRELRRLFPCGFSAPDIVDEIAFDQFPDLAGKNQIETDRNVRELVGRCLWDVFSNQHEVIDAEGRLIHLGSFRAAGDFLAKFSNRRARRREFDYLNFYMGTSAPWVEQSNFTSVYELIFRRLKRRSLEWIYHFPRIYLVDFRPLREAIDRAEKPDWAEYSPEQALAAEFENKEREEELSEIRNRLDEDRNQAIDEAARNPAPTIVQAYQNVHEKWPQGWPPLSGG